MKIKKILCPVDFSRYTDRASEFASIFAKASGAEIVFLHVAPQGAYNGDYGYAMERTAEHAMARLVSVEPTIEGIKFSHDVKVCMMIADSIVEYASEHDIDLIVLPTHGRTGLRRLVLGSVAEAVLRRANCAVATVRPNSNFFNQNPISDWSAESVPTS
jgi:nucleotide-binding universal stress UspA family protein